jgi:hypothetical protein
VKKILALGCLALIMAACKSKQIQNQENEVEAMMQQTDSLHTSLLKNKMDSLLEMRIAATSLIIRVKTNYAPKKIDLIFGKKVEDFKQIQRELKERKKNGKRNIPGDYVFTN